MIPETPAARVGAGPGNERSKLQSWSLALLPLALLAVLVASLVRFNPGEVLRGVGHPPVERLTFQQARLQADGIWLPVMNDGPDPVTIAQVTVDDAFWAFEATGGRELRHLQRTTLHIPYPWVEGEAHLVRVITSTGATFDHEIVVAVAAPQATGRFTTVFVLIGLYVGVLPVAIGLLWYPMVARLGARGLDFVLGLTIGLLLFLMVDAVREGTEAAASLPGSYQGVALLAFGSLGAYLALEAIGSWLRARRRSVSGDGWVLALLMAIGIGLHNFGEGLAIGAAYTLGEAALGTLLIVGFTLHNTTEGLAIVAPLARERTRLRDLLLLGLIGGAPTIGGALAGGLVYSPVMAVLFLAIGAGAIGQVLWQIARQLAGRRRMTELFAGGPALAGLCAGFALMYTTGLLLG